MASEIEMPLSVAFAPHIVKDMNATEYGAYAALIHKFWMNQIEIDESQDSRLAILANCSDRRWASVKKIVKAAIRQAMPRASSVYAQKLATKKRMSLLGSIHGAKNLNGGVSAKVPLSDTQTDTLPTVVSKHTEFRGNGKYDHSARQAAVKRESSTRPAAPRRGSLSDKGRKK